MNIDMENNYNPNPSVEFIELGDSDFEADYDMQDYFASYNY